MQNERDKWREWVRFGYPWACDLLEKSAELLKEAWQWDMKSPNSFPRNTSHRFALILNGLRGGSGKRQTKAKLPAPQAPTEPQSLGDLLNDKTIRVIYELQNRGSYANALMLAATDPKKGPSAWRKILNAADKAYEIEHYGPEFAPKPRLHFLHNKLLLLTLTEPLKGLTESGKADFFNFMCPCGKQHKANTVGRLQNRATRTKKRNKSKSPKKRRTVARETEAQIPVPSNSN